MNDEDRFYMIIMIQFTLLFIIASGCIICAFFQVDTIASGATNIILKISLVLTEIFLVTGYIMAAVEITKVRKERKEWEEHEKTYAKLGEQKESGNTLTTVRFYSFDDRFLEIDCGTWYYEIQCQVSSKYTKLNNVLYKWMKKIDKKNEKKAKKVKKPR